MDAGPSDHEWASQEHQFVYHEPVQFLASVLALED
jgi:hypothetical protein